MTLSLILAGLWAVGVNILAAMLPQTMRTRMYIAMIAAGIPLVGYVTFENGPLVGLAVLLGGTALLRWPLPRLLRRRRARQSG